MNAIELRDEAIRLAQRLGCEVREDWFDGRGGGLCLVRGQKRLFLDVAQTPEEQLDSLAAALRGEAELAGVAMATELADFLGQTAVPPDRAAPQS